MPRLPQAQCETLGCKAPSIPHSRHCATHAPAPRARAAGHDALYKSIAWARLRAAQLSAHPLCQACMAMGRVTSADTVDHVWPWRSIGPHAFRANWLQSLCGPCHSTKTGLERKGVMRHYSPSGPVDYSLADYPTHCGPQRP